jgi:glycerol-3-phosphate acyltransferase PlsY
MWKEITFILIGFILGSVSFSYIILSLLKNMIGDDYEINKPKVKGENNLLQVFQSNKKENKSKDANNKRIKLFKRKNK